MTVTPGHFQLTSEQRRFQALLNEFPKLVQFWDFETREYDVAALNEAMKFFSPGEQLIASFLVNVWSGNDDAHFPLIDAVKTLDEHNLNHIRQWLNDPFRTARDQRASGLHRIRLPGLYLTDPQSG